MKDLNELTLKEFEQYNDMLKDEDVFGIMELFGIKNPQDLQIDKYTEYWDKIKTMSLSLRGVKTNYIINGKRFKPELKILNLSAGQFIDLQNYMKSYKLHEVLSIFLIPQFRKNFTWRTYKYNDGYDVLEIQEFIRNNMLIGEANELAAFFLKSSGILLKTIVNCSERDLMKARKKKIKRLEKKLMK